MSEDDLTTPTPGTFITDILEELENLEDLVSETKHERRAIRATMDVAHETRRFLKAKTIVFHKKSLARAVAKKAGI